RPVMNKGIVLKYSANQKYTTDAVSEAFFVTVCERAGVPFQRYFNRSNIAGGSTLGNISATHISIDTCDIGLAQLSMHSSYETAGSEDPAYLVSFAAEFFRTEDIIVR
ncbi:MAG: M18 family aminopeptidase, partial [Lachnospiraceae bacterium]|nr:M18 family aminopeptidase [Lachnospiraceae bacterium]